MENKNYSIIYRILHWAIAISLLLLLITIFLRLTWLNKNNVAAIIKDFLEANGQSLSDDDLLKLAKKIRQPMWQWHIYIGYVLIGLFGLRFAMPLFGEMKFQNPLKKNISAKLRFQYGSYLVFYVCIIISLTTGAFIELGPESLEEPMEEVHVLSIYYLLAYIVIHLGGVLLAEFTNEKGIVSRIVSGKREDK